MAHKYLVDLTGAEQGYLLGLIHQGKPAARKVARAPVLFRAAAGATDEEIAPALHLGAATVQRTRQRLGDAGLLAALSERPRAGPPPTLTGNQTALGVALAWSTPPAGRPRWTLQVWAERCSALRQLATIAPDTGRRVLQKTTANPGSVQHGAVPVAVPTLAGTGRLGWTCRLSPLSPATRKCAVTKVVLTMVMLCSENPV